ncbi:MAG: c-type cytochrome [Candidatus Methylacidiphilales bacterium]
MMRVFFFAYLITLLLVVSIFGFRGQISKRTPFEIFDDMDHQAKYKSQSISYLFADGRADRPPIPGTIPFNRPVEDEYYLTGQMDGNWGAGFPREITAAVLERGRERYNINCTICHGETGAGNGITTQYGVAGVANFHSDRFREMPEGQIYNTILHGKGLMLGLPHIQPDDAWAIVAYIRVLQRSKNAALADVPEEEKEKLK